MCEDEFVLCFERDVGRVRDERIMKGREGKGRVEIWTVVSSAMILSI